MAPCQATSSWASEPLRTSPVGCPPMALPARSVGILPRQDDGLTRAMASGGYRGPGNFAAAVLVEAARRSESRPMCTRAWGGGAKAASGSAPRQPLRILRDCRRRCNSTPWAAAVEIQRLSA
ncbi:hypothetical protein ACJBU6_00226 [Exserohilum turcicum]